MQSAVLMLAHIGEREAAVRLQNALHNVYADGDRLTGDVGGKGSTTEFTDAVIARIQDCPAD
jgi:isocitrate dehydrogenase (NAD+)